MILKKTSLNIVGDQKGTPTSVDLLADVTYTIVKTILNKASFEDFGIYHVALGGETNWYQYSCFITDEAIRLGLKTTMASKDIKSISSEAYLALAKRPKNSRLDTTKIERTFTLELPSWKAQVAAVLKIASIIN